MNLLTINNENLIGFNIYNFLKYYQNDIGYTIDAENEGYLFLYDQFFPCQVFDILRNEKDVDLFIDERIDNLYKLSLTKLEKTKKIYFFYTFTFYSKYDFNFNILEKLKSRIENKFKKEVIFILNNHMEDDNYIHFNSYRYDTFNEARTTKKIKINNKKEKIFLCLNAKQRNHRDDIYQFILEKNLMRDFHFAYIERNINLWQTNIFSEFVDKYFRNENNSGHNAFEHYINDDLFNTRHGMFFDTSYYYISTETSAHDQICFMGEKTYKAIYHKIPFIILGNPYSLKNLKKEGFKTFDKWIDESYDNETNYEKRKKMIFDEILRLDNLSISRHEKNISEMEEIIEFNHNHFLDVRDIKKEFLRFF